MRLLDTATLRLTEFSDHIPEYAILSHRWDGSEVSFQDLQNESWVQMAAGYAKIMGCCRQAAFDGWQFIWIDSCCIDKTNSAEVSEAINSMFRWYRGATVCYVYLADVQSSRADHKLDGSDFRRSKWFTRGWTLPELLAPESVVFFDRSWNEIGTKSSLEYLISEITSIGVDELVDFTSACIARKMSWSSHRQTTRVEDMAYCLMGLFDINMPIMYGEGEKAFLRLQNELLKISDDESIFAWTLHEKLRFVPDSNFGLLASGPHNFSYSGDIVRFPYDPERPPHSMTNKGLRMELYLKESRANAGNSRRIFLAPLNCSRQHSTDPIAIKVVSKGGQVFMRDNLDLFPFTGDIRTVKTSERQLAYFPQVKPTDKPCNSYLFSISTQSIAEQGFIIDDHYESHIPQGWSGDGLIKLLLEIDQDEVAGLMFKSALPSTFCLVLDTFDNRVRANLMFLEPSETKPLADIVAPLYGNEHTRKFLRRWDRISTPFGRNRTISVTLRRGAMVPSRGPRLHYLVNISIH